MIYQRKPAARSLGVYGVAVKRTGVAPPRNVARCPPGWYRDPYGGCFNPNAPTAIGVSGYGRYGDGDCGVNPQFDPQTDLNFPDRMSGLRALRYADGDCGVSPMFDPQTDLNFPDRMSGIRYGRRPRFAGLRFHGFGASFGDDSGYQPWDITQTYTDTTSPYATTPNDGGPSTSTPTTNGDIPTGSQQNTQDFNTNLQNNPAADVAAGAGASTSTQSWFNTAGQAAQGTTGLIGGLLKAFGVNTGTQGTGGPKAGNSTISIAVLGAVVLGAGALYLANSRKKA